MHRVPGPARLAPPDPLGVFVAALATAVNRADPGHGSARRLALRQVVEPGDGLLEMEVDGSGGAVTVLGDEDFGHALEAPALDIFPVVHLGPVNEDHHVGILRCQ